MSTPKILLFDIETTPLLSYTWRTWQSDSIKLIEDFYVLCYSYKWLGQKTTHVNSLIDYKNYKKNIKCDKDLMTDLWKLMDEADIVCGHNSDKFDVKKVNARFIQLGLGPYSPVRKIDTIKMARKEFGFTSNRLDDLGRFLGVGAKTANKGKLAMWFNCMAGNSTTEQKKAWRDMIKYAKQDTVLLERVYNKLRPWSMPVNLGMYVDSDEPVCPKCGHNKLMKRGYSMTNAGVYQRYQCKNPECRGYSRARKKLENSTQNPLT